MIEPRCTQLAAFAALLALSGCVSEPPPSAAMDPAAEAPAMTTAFAPTTPTIEPVAFDGGLSLWGELPGRGSGPVDASDNLRQVSFTQEGADFDVAVDPSGERIVFASTRHRSTADLYVKGVDGSTITQFTNDLGNDVMPTWSPDGSAIAFCSDRSGNWDIYIQKLDGGQPFQLTNDPSHEMHPSFSPDGRQIVLCSLATSGQWEIVVVDVESPAKRRILGFGLFPQFSPMGDKIVFQRARQRGSRLFSVWTLDYVNGEAVRPTEIAAATNAAVINPAWSPDGRRLAFSSVVDPTGEYSDKPHAADLWAINIDGTGRVKLTNDSHANLQPAWSSQGAIYFISNRNGPDNVWSLRPTNAAMLAMPVTRRIDAQAEVPTP